MHVHLHSPVQLFVFIPIRWSVPDVLFVFQIVPYLICMSTDVEKVVSHSADKQLQDIEKKYPGFIHMKSQSGIRLSYKLQKILQSDGSGIVRGYRVREGEFPGALNGFLYSILRNTKQQRRALVLSVLKQFDEQVVSYVMINPLALKLDIYSLAHHLCKM